MIFKNKLFLKKNLIVIFLVVAAILLRFVFLDLVPTAINKDELHYALSSKALYVTGREITGEVNLIDILTFKYPKDEPMQAELPYLLESIFVGPLNFNLPNTTFPNAFLSILTVVLVYLITKKLFSERIAVIAGLMTVINPWLIFLGRTTYEGGLATCLFLIVFYLFLTLKNLKIFYILPVALLAFYSNIGTKLIFFPFILLSAAYAYLFVNNKKYFKLYAIVVSLSLLLVLFFIFRLNLYSGERISELITPNTPRIVEQVNELRATTISNPLMVLSENKYYLYITILTKNMFNAISPYYLFAGGDYFYMIGIHGLFYYIDFVFVIIGLIALFSYKKKLLFFLSLFLFMSLLPQIFHDPQGGGNFTHHIVLFVPFLIMIISYGIYYSLKLIKNKKYNLLAVFCIIIVYIFLFLSFLNAYFFRFPLQDGTFETNNRILSRYLILPGNINNKIVVYSVNPRLNFREFLYYSNFYNKDSLRTINRSLEKEEYVYKNISFLYCVDKFPQNTIVINSVDCKKHPSEKSLSIVQLKDSGVKYKIYKDNVCSRFTLPRYISNLKLSDLNIEGLSVKIFCETYVVSN